jgi:hypothetical protein
MIADMEREKVKQRVVKLMNVTLDRGASENEALLAAEKAEELMVHYDIQLSELSLRSARAVQKTVLFRRYGNRRLALENARNIAGLCDCMYWLSKLKITFFGLPHEAEIATHLFETISNCVAAEIDIYRNSNAFAAEKKANSGLHSRIIIGDFIDGIEKRLNARLKELDAIKGRTIQEATGRSLVPMKMEQIKEDFKATGIKLHTIYSYGRRTSSSAAYRSGMAAGDRISLSPGVKSNSIAERLK